MIGLYLLHIQDLRLKDNWPAAVIVMEMSDVFAIEVAAPKLKSDDFVL